MKQIIFFFTAIILSIYGNAQNFPQPDPTYGSSTGIITTSIQNVDKSNFVLVQPDKKVILGGNSTGHPIYGPRFGALVRYNENGSLDVSFGENGIVELDDVNCTTLALQSDGKILVGGQYNTVSGVVRLMPDGSLDETFGNGGFFSLGDSISVVYDLSVLSDGSIIGVGIIVNAESNISKIFKINSNGQLVNNFGDNGAIVSQFGFTSVNTRRILSLPNGKFLVGGYAVSDNEGTEELNLLLGKFNSDGTLDESFGDNGIALHNSSTKSLADFDLTPNGKIIAVGNIETNSMGTYGDFIITRFNADGSLDESFGENSGYTRASFDIYAEYVTQVQIFPDNKIYVAGSYWSSYTKGFLTRFDTNGIMDQTYGDEGLFSTIGQTITGMALTPDNKIVLTAQSPNVGASFRSTRLLTDIPFDENQFNEVVINSNPENAGTATGGGYYDNGETVTVTAYAKPGYIFENWQSDGEIISNESPFSFTIYENEELTANFSETAYNVQTSSNPEEGGTTTGGGTYLYDEIANFSATANEGYTFVNWTKDGIIVSDNSNFSMEVQSDLNLVANFIANTYTVSASANPAEGGTIIGTGTYAYGENANLTAIPNAGYTFINWTENGDEISTNPDLTIEINSERNLTANFSINTYTVSGLANPEEGGWISGLGTFEYGDFAYLIATANEGYTFINWTEDGNEISTNPNLVTQVLADRNLNANFELQMNTTDLENHQINIAPNPFDKYVSIQSKNHPFDKIELFDLSGKLMKTISVSNQKDFEMQTGDLAPGIYLLKIYMRNDVETYKLIKQ